MSFEMPFTLPDEINSRGRLNRAFLRAQQGTVLDCQHSSPLERQLAADLQVFRLAK